MKTIKKFLTIILSVLLMLCVSVSFVGCSFSFKDIPTPDYSFTYGDFKCCYVTSATSNRAVEKESAVGVNVLNFVEVEKKWERVIIPETIDGLPVIAIGMGGIGWTRYLQGYYNKIYLPDSVLNIHDVGRSIHHRKVFLTDEYGAVDWDSRTTLLQNILLEFSDMQVFVAESLYQGYQTLSNIKNSECISIANLSYVVDNKIYWIDDYADGESIVFPDAPIKEGFIFDGWYKDNNYVEKWNIETDKYIQNEDLASVKLYGKFVIEY